MNETVKSFAKLLIPASSRSRLKERYRRARYFGFKYQCPFCESRLRSMLPCGLDLPVLAEMKVIGGGYRQEAICPVCGSFDRERLLYLFLLHKTDIFTKRTKLLHVAPESRVARILQSQVNVEYLTADIALRDVMVRMDITDIDFPDETFDAIICNHVLEHVVDDNKAMHELYRTLKSGGWAILQVPISPTLEHTYEDASITTATGREMAFGQADHVRIYAEDYRERLAGAGFEVTVFGWVTEAEKFGGGRHVFGLNEDECVYFVRKQPKT